VRNSDVSFSGAGAFSSPVLLRVASRSCSFFSPSCTEVFRSTAALSRVSSLRLFSCSTFFDWTVYPLGLPFFSSPCPSGAGLSPFDGRVFSGSSVWRLPYVLVLSFSLSHLLEKCSGVNEYATIFFLLFGVVCSFFCFWLFFFFFLFLLGGRGGVFCGSPFPSVTAFGLPFLCGVKLVVPSFMYFLLLMNRETCLFFGSTTFSPP